MWHVWGKIRNGYRILRGTSKNGRHYYKPRHRSKNDIKMDFKVTGWEVLDLIYMVQGGD